jgi:hypothetical protein
MVLLELVGGIPTQGWSRLAEQFDVPWVRESDQDQLRTDVMTFYHIEDILEPRAEAVLNANDVSPELAQRVIIDHALQTLRA